MTDETDFLIERGPFEAARAKGYEGGAAEGIHIAAAGINWQMAILGFGGLHTAMNADALTLTPHVPPGWSRLAYPVVWKGQSAWVDIRPGSASITNRSDAPLIVVLPSEALAVAAGATETRPSLA